MKPKLLFALTLALTSLAIGAGAKNQSDTDNLIGTWDVKGTAPNGDTRESLLTFEQKNGKLDCVASGEWGDMEMDSVDIDGKKVVLEMKFDRDGATGSLKVAATETGDGKLAGTWSIERDGADKISGAWQATKRKTVDLTGSWLAGGISENGGKPYPFKLEFKGTGKNLSATSTTDRGTRQLEAVLFDGTSLNFDSKIQLEDNRFTVSAKADIQDDGALSGTYQTKKADGEVIDKGTWTAARAKEPAAPDVSGEWKTTVNYEDQSRDYGLKISKTEKGLEATTIDQQGTEHPCKSASFKGGQLTISTAVEYEGQDVEIRYEAKLGDDGKLEGKYYAVGYEEQFKGTWSGTRSN
ncbi:MAG: hypothetical protein ACI9MB_005133 [Verrucomicrobiales bacterium]|jgi:hypothetical protein